MINLTTIKETLKIIIDALQLPSIFPSLILVYFNFYFVLPNIFVKNEWTLSNTDYLILSIFICIILSYLLFSLNFSIIRFFEGYPWKNTWYGKSRYRKYTTDFENILAFYRKTKDDKAKESLHFNFPLDKENILPTKLGNIIAAFEYYPFHRYGIDAVELWPRLVAVLIDENYNKMITQQKSQLDFMLNMTLVSFVCGIEILIVYLFEKNWDYAILSSLITLIVVSFFYWTSKSAAFSWGYSIRVAFDIFKNKLREKLGMKAPKDFFEEKKQWEDVSSFLLYGEAEEINNIYNYQKLEQNED